MINVFLGLRSGGFRIHLEKSATRHVTQLRSLEEFYPRPGVHNHLSEFFLLDVVLNRARPLREEGVAHLAERDPDAVALASAYTDSNFEDRKDYEYCAVLAFLPGAGVF